MPPEARPAQTAPLTPAPDNGQHYTDAGRASGRRGTPSEPAIWGRKLSNRVPQDLYDALEVRAERLGVPVGALIVRALRAEVAGGVLADDLLDRLAATAEAAGSTPERVLAAAVEAEAARRGC
ncbi:hypothetical protein [Allobranchiibius huperziae]|uniref:Uncharacterized protein n=1 Tax=Allobranchiibius huperziae TaxID=1874116 RepID=A0A853DMF8_9MICO|nr:hypothetical protein [Allobranchiibius huperziae]NYJ75810.1 hypothetical protein [Allobranchiibius huperziae]